MEVITSIVSQTVVGVVVGGCLNAFITIDDTKTPEKTIPFTAAQLFASVLAIETYKRFCVFE